MRKTLIASAIACATLTAAYSTLAPAAGITVYKDGDRYVKLGGRIQLQYHREDPDAGEATDEVLLRRFRPYIEGSLHKDWKGKFQVDFGKSDVKVKDAYMQYKGLDNVTVSVGNKKFPFSREALTSSKKQQLVERTFVGDHNYGVPDRNAGIHLAGHNSDKILTWGAAFASSSIDPDQKKLDFDTPVNKSSDFNEGWIVGGRLDYHPFGHLKFSQGDFKREKKATIGAAVFGWWNDGDNNTNTVGGIDQGNGKPDIDQVVGFEISGAIRGMGASVDAEYNRFDADTVDRNFTGGLYRNGTTTLQNWSIEGGYMIMPSRLELVAGYQSQDADNYATEWTRASFGANWFVHKHDIKAQLTYRINSDKDGVRGKDEDELFLQAQYVF